MPKQFDATLPRSCSWHYGFSVISAGGPLTPCCGVAKDKDDFGTVVPGQTSFTEIWNNDLFTKSRMAMGGKPTDGLDHIDTVCMRCYLPKMVHHIYNDQDRLVAQRFGEVFGESEPEMARRSCCWAMASAILMPPVSSLTTSKTWVWMRPRVWTRQNVTANCINYRDRQQNEMSRAQATEILKDFRPPHLWHRF
ncbi:MAG: SPASM domain-containing protein [Haliea sp.]|nr:SPASM domain-containing protein [Haliea sp.]